MEHEFYLTDREFDTAEYPGLMAGFIVAVRESARDGNDICIYLNTHGGDLYALLELIDVLDSLPTQVTIVAQGRCMSAGIMLLAGWRKGYRYSLPSTIFMWHELQVSNEGGQQGLLADMQFHKKVTDGLRKRVAKNSTLTAKEINEKMERYDYYFDAKEALKLGFIDGIITTDRVGIRPDEEDLYTDEDGAPYNPEWPESSGDETV